MLDYIERNWKRPVKKKTVQKHLKFLISVLVIEEPELFQHPNRQRHFSKVLLQLANGTLPGVAKKTQIIYCTHSPLFVGIDRINEIRLLKKIENVRGNPKVTKVVIQICNALPKICAVFMLSRRDISPRKIFSHG